MPKVRQQNTSPWEMPFRDNTLKVSRVLNSSLEHTHTYDVKGGSTKRKESKFLFG